jgi:hypothetical protein
LDPKANATIVICNDNVVKIYNTMSGLHSRLYIIVHSYENKKYFILFGEKKILAFCNAGVVVKVTRLGKFYPIWQLISWVSFSKITEAAQIRGATFSKVIFVF